MQRASGDLAPIDWLLAETVRRAEEAAGESPTEDDATRRACSASGSISARIVERARRRPGGPALAEEIRHALGAMRWTFVAVLVAGLVAGITAASTVQTAAGTIALSYALVALLAVPNALLIVWIAFSLRTGRDGVAAGGPGRLGWRLVRWLARVPGGAAEARRYRLHLAASLAAFGRNRGRSLLALVSHGFWAMFFAGAIGWLWLRFLGLRFDFSWETTLLAGEGMRGVIAAVGALPAWLFGFEPPDAGQIEAVLVDRSPPADRALWARYLLGSLAVYGLAPRALLALWFAWRWRRVRLALDLGRPGYLRLLPVLAGGPSESTGPIGPPAAAFPEHDSKRTPAEPGAGEPILIGVELDRGEADWPPDFPGGRALGRADDRRQRHQLEQALEMLEPRPQKIVALCSLARTPDRGTGEWLSRLNAIAPVELALDDAEGTAGAAIDADARRQDWQRLAERFGLAFAPIGAAGGP